MLELEVSSEAEARALHAEVMTHFRERVAPVLGEVLDAVCPEDRTLRVERLEIELDALPRARFLEELVLRVRARLPTELGRIQTRDDAAGELAPGARWLTPDAVELETLVHFLATGTLRWGDAGLERAELEALPERLSERVPENLVAALRRMPAERVAARLARLGVRASQAVVRLLAARRFDLGDWVRDGLRLRAALSVILKQAGEASAVATPPAIGSVRATPALLEFVTEAEHDAHTRLTAYAVKAALAGGAEPEDTALGFLVTLRGAGPHDELRRLFSATAKVLPAASPVRRAIERDAGRSTPPERPRRTSEPASERARDGLRGRETGPSTAAPAEPVASLGGETAPAVHDPEASTVATRGEAGRAAPAISPRAEGVSERTAPDLVSPSRGDQAQPGDPDSPHSATSEKRELTPRVDTWPTGEALLFAPNAGLVLVWPFLPGFLAKLGLTDGAAFTNETARARAVLLLQYLATGENECGEHELTVPRLLCGLPLEEPVSTRFEPAPEEVGEAQELLASVITHWRALGSTSVAGLRGAFLSRTGSLTQGASGAVLRIERTGRDVLVDRLPWGIGLVLLPWMRSPLHVEW